MRNKTNSKKASSLYLEEDEFRDAVDVARLAEMFIDAFENSNYGILSEIPMFVKQINLCLYRGTSQRKAAMKKAGSYDHSEWHMWADSRSLASRFADQNGSVMVMQYKGQAVDVDAIYKHLWKVYEKNKKEWAQLGGALKTYWSEERGSFILPPSFYVVLGEKDGLVEVEIA